MDNSTERHRIRYKEQRGYDTDPCKKLPTSIALESYIFSQIPEYLPTECMVIIPHFLFVQLCV